MRLLGDWHIHYLTKYIGVRGRHLRHHFSSWKCVFYYTLHSIIDIDLVPFYHFTILYDLHSHLSQLDSVHSCSQYI